MTVVRTPQGVIAALAATSRSTRARRRAHSPTSIASRRSRAKRACGCCSPTRPTPTARARREARPRSAPCSRGVFQARSGPAHHVASFASHVHRLQQVADIAVERGPQDRAARAVDGAQHQAGAATSGCCTSRRKSIADAESSSELDPARDLRRLHRLAGRIPQPCCGRWSSVRIATVKIAKDDTVVFSAHPIPGNEASVARLRNGLAQLGADVVHSGHSRSAHQRPRQAGRARPCSTGGEPRVVRARSRRARAPRRARAARRRARHARGPVARLPRRRHARARRRRHRTGRAEFPAGEVYVDGTVDGVDDEVLRQRKTARRRTGSSRSWCDVDLATAGSVDGPEVISRGWATDRDRAELHEAVAACGAQRSGARTRRTRCDA